MALLPISKKDITTPYNVSTEEAAELVITSSNRASVARRGGFCFSMVMGVRPYNLLQDKDNTRYWSIATTLARYPYLQIPIYNIIASPGFNPKLTNLPFLTVSIAALPGDSEVVLTNDVSSALRVGQFISFGDKSKVYQVARIDKSKIELSHPLVQHVPQLEPLNYMCKDYYGNNVDGVMGYFVNEDFGNPVCSIDDGILGNIGPLKFREKK